MAAWETVTPELQKTAVKQSTISYIERRLLDLADGRISLMDKVGINT